MRVGIEVDRFAELLLTAQVKGVVVLLVVALAAVALRRGAAATRHWLWFVGMVGLLALPGLGAVLPRWSVEVPAWAGARSTGLRATPALEALHAPAVVDAPEATAAFERAPSAARRERAPEAPDAAADHGGTAEPAWARVTPPARLRAERPAAASSGAGAFTITALPSGAALLIGVWGLGAALLLASLAASLLAVARLSARSFEFPHGRVTELTERMRLGMGIETRIRVLRGEPGAMPMSWGIVRPVILLPEGAERWHNTRLVSVLLHELSHVKRRDCFSQIVAEIALALHWPNPLAWLAARRLRVEREHACDDAVVAAGARPSDYAEELISLAKGFQTPPRTSMAAVAMARPVHLAGRIRALLLEPRGRRLSGGGALACACVALGASAAVASLSPTTAPQRAPFPQVIPASAPAPAPHIVPPAPLREALVAPSAVTVAEAIADVPVAARPHIVPPEPAWQALIPAGLAELISLRAIRPATRQAAQAATCGMATTGWQRSTVNSNDDTHRLSWSRPGCDVEVRVEGNVEFTADFRDVARLGSGALLRIEEEDGPTERRLDVTPGGGGAPAYQYRLDGNERPFDAAARAWYEGMLLQVFRRGGFMAEERVAAMLRTGGVAAVLQELDVLSSDHVFATYARELLEQADVSASQAVELMSRASQRVDSDHYMAEILDAVADRHLGSDEILDAFIASARTIESDHYRSEVLGRALQMQNLTPERVALVLGSASEIDSDHYLAQMLEGVASRYALEPALREVYLRAVDSIESDHYRSEVLSTLLARSDLEAEELAVVLAAANGLDSDHYRAEILGRIATRALPSDPMRAAYLQAASGIESDHYRREALGHLLERETLTASQLQELVRAAAGIDSDHYKADLLIDVVRRHRLEGATREAFLQAMDSIGSSHYRGEVAGALLRSDRGGV
jgi:beta-lactamase regulating signal transducer with metallopeptidase domain